MHSNPPTLFLATLLSLCALTYASRGLNQAHLTAPCYVPDSWQVV